MTVGEGVDSVIAASLIGLGRAVKATAVVGHRLLTLRPARVDADLRSYLAMRSLSDEAALVAAEEQVEVLDPFYSDGGPTEWLRQPTTCPIGGVCPPDCDRTQPGCAPPPDEPHVGVLLDDRPGVVQFAPLSDVSPVNPAGTGAQAGTGGSPKDVEQIVADVLMEHWYRAADHSSIGREAHCGCGGRPIDQRDWQWHVAHLIDAALK